MTISGRAGLLLMGALVTHLLSAGGDGVHVCVGADQVLRLQRSGRCTPGSTEYVLAKAEPEQPDAPDDVKSDGDVPALKRQVAALSEQVAAASRQAASRTDALATQVTSRIVAPFTVVDKAGKTIFAVRAEPRGLVLMDNQSRTVVAASALADGGFIKARDGTGALETVMGVNGKFAGFVLRKDGKARGSFDVAEDGKPILNLSNANSVTVVALTQEASGGGYLQLGNAAGATTVEAGTTPSGVGLVRAFPLGSPGAGLVGMPGTFILGRK
ncbi:MAG TPA: hypothetical protein VFW66_08015 [Gemmatimonadales bacterium]|nr:hypothetical protein [Gemmatimonadales bacterium]